MNLDDYKLVWADDFDYEGQPDPDKWSCEVGNFQWPNRELQAYTDRPNNIFVKNGRLTIRSVKEQDGEREYTSAKINTNHKAFWQYGYFDIRAKLPGGVGSWPAIWMMPYKEKRVLPDRVPKRSDGRPDFEKFTEEDWARFPKMPKKDRWPDCGEIDIIEHIGRRPNSLLFSLHSGMFNHRTGNPNPFSNHKKYDYNPPDDFHNYSMEWTPDYFEFFVDGESQFKYERPDVPEEQMYDAWPFDKPYYLIMNTAVGGGLGGPVTDKDLPYIFEIEYVHVYQKKNAVRPFCK